MGNAYDRCPTADEGSRGWRRGRKLSRIMSGNNFRETARGFLYFSGFDSRFLSLILFLGKSEEVRGKK